MTVRTSTVIDHILLLGVPLAAAGVLLAGTLTPGNPLIGLIIGWVTVTIWMALGTFVAWKRYWKK